ncbi:MAG: hypothetical protein WC522_07670 [Candidatus Omnitrophota bacterium]
MNNGQPSSISNLIEYLKKNKFTIISCINTDNFGDQQTIFSNESILLSISRDRLRWIIEIGHTSDKSNMFDVPLLMNYVKYSLADVVSLDDQCTFLINKWDIIRDLFSADKYASTINALHALAEKRIKKLLGPNAWENK